MWAPPPRQPIGIAGDGLYNSAMRRYYNILQSAITNYTVLYYTILYYTIL